MHEYYTIELSFLKTGNLRMYLVYHPEYDNEHRNSNLHEHYNGEYKRVEGCISICTSTQDGWEPSNPESGSC